LKISWERLQLRIDEKKGKPTISDVIPFCQKLLKETKFVVVHSGTAKSPDLNFEYKDIPSQTHEKEPINFMVLFGGNMLSRGVTVPGLCVNYYLRAAVTDILDSSLQFQRILGHKEDFRDLITLYTPQRQVDLLLAIREHDLMLRQNLKENIINRTDSKSIFLPLASSNKPVFRLTATSRSKNMSGGDAAKNTILKEPARDNEGARANYTSFTNFLENLKKKHTKFLSVEDKFDMYSLEDVSLVEEFLLVLKSQNNAVDVPKKMRMRLKSSPKKFNQCHYT